MYYKKKICLFLLILSVNFIFSANYYIDSVAGIDSNNGTSISTAWKNISMLNLLTITAGSNVYLKCGSVWDGQQLKFIGSGTALNPIVINRYGTGTNPILNGNGLVGEGVVYLYNQEYIEINNLEITNYPILSVFAINTDYSINQIVYNGLNAYKVTTAGTTGLSESAPTNTSGTSLSGSVTFSFYCNLTNASYPDNLFFTGISDGTLNNNPLGADRRGVMVAIDGYGTANHVYLNNLNIHHIKGQLGNSNFAINNAITKRTGGIYFSVLGFTESITNKSRFNDIQISGCNISYSENIGLAFDNEWKVYYPGSTEYTNWFDRRFTNIHILNNVIHHIGKNAMIIRCTDQTGLIENNTCYETALGTTGNTIFTARAKGTVFQYNEGYFNRATTQTVNPGNVDGSMYDPDFGSIGIIFQYSYSHDNSEGIYWGCNTRGSANNTSGIPDPEDVGCTLRYCISQNDKGDLVFLNYSSAGNEIYNNVFYIKSGLRPNIIHENSGNNHTYNFFNNIIYNAGTGGYAFATIGQNRTIENNIFYGNHPSDEPTDINKLILNPLLVNPGNGLVGITTLDGYKLNSNSPAISSGKLISNNGGVDYYGNLVSSINIPSRGMHEFIPPCTNPINGGTISSSQTICQGQIPSPFLELIAPSGQIGTIEYQWQSSIDNINFINIINQNQSSYSINISPNTTTYYRRLARVLCKLDWLNAAISNIVTVSVNQKVTPTFTQISAICSGDALSSLPTTSLNDITGSWEPALNNTITSTYTFTPTNGLCANNATMIITVNPLPIVTASNVVGCSGIPMSLIGAPSGGTFSITNPYNGTVNTTYTYSYTDGNGCSSSSLPATITINNSTSSSQSVTACNSYTWSANSQTYTTSGTYTLTSTNPAGCTDTKTLFLTINNSTSSSQSVTACNSYTWSINNQTYTTSGTYISTSSNTAGCLDTKTLVLTINNISSVATPAQGGGTVCSGSGSGTLSLAVGYIGSIQWMYSIDGGINYLPAPNNSTSAIGLSFSTSSVNSTGSTYIVTNISSSVKFLARVTNGPCSSAYSNVLTFFIGTQAIAGTITASTTDSLCPGTGTLLTLSDNIGTVTWQKTLYPVVSSSTWTSLAGVGKTTATGNLTVSTVFRASVTIGSCSQIVYTTYAVLIKPKPVSKTITASASTPSGSAKAPLCTSFTSKVLTIGAGSSGSIQWQRFVSAVSLTTTQLNSVAWSNITNATGISYTIISPQIGFNYFRARFSDGCGTVVYNAALVVVFKTCVTKLDISSLPSVFEVIVVPNPSTYNFNLSVNSSSEERVNISVYDITGRLIDKADINPRAVSNLQLGEAYPSGVFTVIVSQQDYGKTIRIVKK